MGIEKNVIFTHEKPNVNILFSWVLPPEQKGAFLIEKIWKIQHRYIEKKTGTKMAVWYDKEIVKSRIKRHKKRLRESKKKHKQNPTNRLKNSIENNQSWITYWEGRVKEFGVKYRNSEQKIKPKIPNYSG